MNISFNTKGTRTYARFRDNGEREIHLGNKLSDCIQMLQYTFYQRQYIELGKATQQDLDRLVIRLTENMKR